MGAGQDKVGPFEKVGEGLYRYAPTGTYYARIQIHYKEVRRNLGTTDRATAKRKLADLHRELTRTNTGHGRITRVSPIPLFCRTGFVTRQTDAGRPR